MGSVTCEQALNLGIESREWPEMGTYSQAMHGRATCQHLSIEITIH